MALSKNSAFCLLLPPDTQVFCYMRAGFITHACHHTLTRCPHRIQEPKASPPSKRTILSSLPCFMSHYLIPPPPAPAPPLFLSSRFAVSCRSHRLQRRCLERGHGFLRPRRQPEEFAELHGSRAERGADDEAGGADIGKPGLNQRRSGRFV